MPTIEQIRAARALLDWSQSDLADQAGLSQTGIARIENGTNRPNSSTIEKITSAFDTADIEFIGETGVKKRTGEIVTLHDIAGFRNFIDSVYETAKNVGGEICVFNSHHANFHKWCGGKEWYDMHAKRMIAVADNIDMKVVVAEEDDQFIGHGFAEYRWFPRDLWSDQTIYSYGDYLAFLNFRENDVKIMILKHRKFTEGFRVLFNIAWNEVAQIPPKAKHS